MSIKKQRIKQFNEFNSGVTMGISLTLLHCAFTELIAAHGYRKQSPRRLKHNHYSPNAVGSIVLLVTALDVWLNEIINGMCKLGTDRYGVMKFSNVPIIEKYKGIINAKTGKNLEIDDLNTVVELRNEFVHFLPRVIPGKGSKKNIPPWFYKLRKEGLLLDYPVVNDETPLGRNLTSYALAYWSWKTVITAVKELVNALGSDSGYYFFGPTPGTFTMEFGMFLKIDTIMGFLSPDKLPENQP
jgi:hypothetical protein